VEVIADAQDATLAMDVAREGVFNGGILQRGGEDFAGRVAHARKLLIALRSQIGH
jgi:hypothetical protein